VHSALASPVITRSAKAGNTKGLLRDVDEPELPDQPQATYPLVMNGDVWVGAITTLIGAALGGAISFILSRQQLNDARLQRKEADIVDRCRRSEDRRFQAYSEFLTRTRSYRNAIGAYYLHSDGQPSIEVLDALLQAANDASALVFLVVESEDTYRGSVAVMEALWRARSIIHGFEKKSPDDPWREINEEFGRTMRQLQNAARHELGVGGPNHPWVADERTYPYPKSKSNLQTPPRAQ